MKSIFLPSLWSISVASALYVILALGSFFSTACSDRWKKTFRRKNIIKEKMKNRMNNVCVNAFSYFQPLKAWKRLEGKIYFKKKWKTTRLNYVFVNDFSLGKFFFFNRRVCSCLWRKTFRRKNIIREKNRKQHE